MYDFSIVPIETVYQISCLYGFSIKSFQGWLNPLLGIKSVFKNIDSLCLLYNLLLHVRRDIRFEVFCYKQINIDIKSVSKKVFQNIIEYNDDM